MHINVRLGQIPILGFLCTTIMERPLPAGITYGGSYNPQLYGRGSDAMHRGTLVGRGHVMECLIAKYNMLLS